MAILTGASVFTAFSYFPTPDSSSRRHAGFRRSFSLGNGDLVLSPPPSGKPRAAAAGR